MRTSKRAASQSPQHFNKSAIKFVHEQDGSAERDLKDELVALLRGEPTVQRAYLVCADYGDGTGLSVALCLSSIVRESPSVVTSVGKIFAAMFGAHEHLDILFVNEDEEQQLSLVCEPFYDTR